MPDENQTKLRLEIAHVLFIDIVGYSKLRISQQSELLRELNKIVTATQEFCAADSEGKLIRLPTGDGMALVFRTSPEAPAQCALEISQALKEHHSDIQLRMGIHSGPVNEVADVNQRSNIAGAGINIAQRVMDGGDAGHILVSKHVAEDLEQYDHWQPCLHDLGECEVKHGVRVHLFNLYTNEVGNSALPEKFKSAAAVAITPKRGVNRKALLLSATVAVLLLGLGGYWLFKRSSTAPVAAIAQKSIAILPFENLSEDKANAYFADGIQDEILTKLASIADLKVISRTSTAKYKSKPEDLKTVSQQLGVANVLEGTVQRAGDKVRVNVQLIDARVDSHLWAKSYDREAKDIFAVESEVSQEVADALQARLSPSEASSLTNLPTRDPEAYDLFLKGEYQAHEAETTIRAEAYDRAASYYQQALERDPNFALAAAHLAVSRVLRHWFIVRLGENELLEVKKLAQHAIDLAPDSPEPHIALGNYYYYGHRQYDDALREFQRALQLQPTNVQVQELIGWIYRRQGKWDLCLATLSKCEERDPRNANLVANIGTTSLNLRLWQNAKRDGLRALALDPNNVVGMRSVFLAHLNGDATIEEARRVFQTFPPGMTLSNPSQTGNVATVVGDGTYIYVIMHEFGLALKAWEKKSDALDEERTRLAARTAIHVLAGDVASATDEIANAQSLVETRLREHPDDVHALSQMSWINLALKHDAEALGHIQKASELLPIEKDAMGGPAAFAGLAEIQARTAKPAEAVKTLQRLLSIPAGVCVSIQRLKIDPVWDPIRNDPGFQQLLAGKELVGSNK